MSWSTSDELNFIDWLGTGTYRNNIRVNSLLRPNSTDTRLAMLKGYQEGIRLRAVWIGLDRPQIEEHVAKLIRSIEQSTKQ